MKLVGRMISTAVTMGALCLSLSIATAVPAAAEGGRNAALFGGLAAGALIGGALASGPRYYGPPPPAPAYGPEPVYASPPIEDADCFYERRPMYDRWGFAGYRRVRVCE